MAGNARAIMRGFEWYASQADGDPRHVEELGSRSLLTLGDYNLGVRLDVVLGAPSDAVGARIVLWDAPRFDERSAEISAYPFAAVLAMIYPETDLTTIQIWQARRQQAFSIPVSAALRQRAAAERLLSR